MMLAGTDRIVTGNRLKLNTEHTAPPGSRGLGLHRALHTSHSRLSTSTSHHPRSPDSRIHSPGSVSIHEEDRKRSSRSSDWGKGHSKPTTAHSTAVLEQMVAANKFGVSGSMQSMQSMSESRDSLREPTRKDVTQTPVINLEDDSDWDDLSTGDDEEDHEEEATQVKPFISCPNSRQLPRRPAPSPAFWQAHARRRSSIERLDLAVSEEAAAALHKVKPPPLGIGAAMRGWASGRCLRKPRRDTMGTR